MIIRSAETIAGRSRQYRDVAIVSLLDTSGPVFPPSRFQVVGSARACWLWDPLGFAGDFD